MVITGGKEHNSNLAPWHVLVREKGIIHKSLRPREDGTFNFEMLEGMMSKNVKVVSLGHVSNIDGTSVPAKEIARLVHDYDAYLVLDAAQSVPHRRVDVQDIDVDFLAFSVHKLCGPTGLGVLYGKEHLLEELSPLITGGGAVSEATYESITLLPPPHKFEAGLQNYAALASASAAVDFVMSIGLENIEEQEERLNTYATKELRDIVHIIGPEDAKLRSGIFNFVVKGLSVYDVGMILEEKNIMLRAGMHCVHSWYLDRGLEGGIRASFYLYNTEEEVKVMVDAVKELVEM